MPPAGCALGMQKPQSQRTPCCVQTSSNPVSGTRASSRPHAHTVRTSSCRAHRTRDTAARRQTLRRAIPAPHPLQSRLRRRRRSDADNHRRKKIRQVDTIAIFHMILLQIRKQKDDDCKYSRLFGAVYSTHHLPRPCLIPRRPAHSRKTHCVAATARAATVR